MNDSLNSKIPMFTEVQEERPDLLKIESILLGLLIVVTISFTYALIHNYIQSRSQTPVLEVQNLFPASKFLLARKSPDRTVVANQPTRLFRSDSWIVADQVFVQNAAPEGWVEWNIPAVPLGKKHVILYLTKSTDYGVVQTYFNDKAVGAPIDLYESSVQPTNGIDLGVIEVKEYAFSMKLMVVGKNPKSMAPFYQFGVQGLVLEPVQ